MNQITTRREVASVQSSRSLQVLFRIPQQAMIDEGTSDIVLGLLDSGQDFATVAEARSTGPGTDVGGDLGYFLPGELLPSLDSVALELRVGERSNIIETEAGFFIIKKTEDGWRRR